MWPPASSCRGTRFRVSTYEDEDGRYYTRLSTLEGSVACRRVLPDGNTDEEEVLVNTDTETLIYKDESGNIVDYVYFDKSGNILTRSELEAQGLNPADYSTTRPIDFTDMPTQVLDYFMERMDEGVTYDAIDSSTKQEISDIIAEGSSREPVIGGGTDNTDSAVKPADTKTSASPAEDLDKTTSDTEIEQQASAAAETEKPVETKPAENKENTKSNAGNQEAAVPAAGLLNNEVLNQLSQFNTVINEQPASANGTQTQTVQSNGGGDDDDGDDEPHKKRQEESESEPEPEVESESESEPESESESESEIESDFESESETESESEIESESESIEPEPLLLGLSYALDPAITGFSVGDSFELSPRLENPMSGASYVYELEDAGSNPEFSLNAETSLLSAKFTKASGERTLTIKVRSQDEKQSARASLTIPAVERIIDRITVDISPSSGSSLTYIYGESLDRNDFDVKVYYQDDPDNPVRDYDYSYQWKITGTSYPDGTVISFSMTDSSSGSEVANRYAEGADSIRISTNDYPDDDGTAKIRVSVKIDGDNPMEYEKDFEIKIRS